MNLNWSKTSLMLHFCYFSFVTKVNQFRVNLEKTLLVLSNISGLTWSPDDCTNRCSSCKGEGRNEQFCMGWRGQAGLLSRASGLDWLKPAMKQLYWRVKAGVKYRCSESYLGGVSRSPRLCIFLSTLQFYTEGKCSSV